MLLHLKLKSNFVIIFKYSILPESTPNTTARFNVDNLGLISIASALDFEIGDMVGDLLSITMSIFSAQMLYFNHLMQCIYIIQSVILFIPPAILCCDIY